MSLDVVGAAQVTLDEKWARNPKVVGLTLLSRSLTNFRAAMLLLNDQHVHVVEARMLARCIYENLIWIGALHDRGFAFVQEMLDDEAANRQVLGELTLKISRQLGENVNDETGLKLRGLIKGTSEKFPGSKKLQANKVAESTVVAAAYVYYYQLSLEAVHCSITALGRHLHREKIEGGYALTVDVHPPAQAREILNTLTHLCRGLLGVAITANELVGFTSQSEALTTLSKEFDLILADAAAALEA